MKLFYGPTSPFVRKVMLVAHETGLADRIEKVSAAAHPVNRDPFIVAHNPLGQVPTLLLDDGTMLADSRVICEYLDQLGGGRLFPASATARWQALTDQALADGIMSASVLVRYEQVVRPEPNRWDAWVKGQYEKINGGLTTYEKGVQRLTGRVDIGTLSVATALSYLDLRFAGHGWRLRAPKLAIWFAEFAKRPSMQATELKA